VRKDLGRRLKGRRVFVLACGSESQLPEGFEVPFRETAAYLEMTWGGSYYARTDAGGILPAGMSGARSFGDRVMAGIDPAAPAHGV
jgi:hypothetical protein